jgi:hypothetical protein
MAYVPHSSGDTPVRQATAAAVGTTRAYPSQELGNFAEHLAAEGLVTVDSDHGFKYRIPRWRLVGAVVLVLVGLALIVISGIIRSWPTGLVGAVLLIPGMYMSWAFWQSYRGNPAFQHEAWLAQSPTASVV